MASGRWASDVGTDCLLGASKLRSQTHDMLRSLVNAVTDLEISGEADARFPELVFIDPDVPYVSEGEGTAQKEDAGKWDGLTPDEVGEEQVHGETVRFVSAFGDGRVRARLRKLDVSKGFWSAAGRETQDAVRLAFRQLDVIERLALAALDPFHKRNKAVGNAAFQRAAEKALYDFAETTETRLARSRGVMLPMRKDPRMNEGFRKLAAEVAALIEAAKTGHNRPLHSDQKRLDELVKRVNGLLVGADISLLVSSERMSSWLKPPKRSLLSIGREVVRFVFPDVTEYDLKYVEPPRGARRKQARVKARVQR